jgi:hypothetical protein
MSKTNHLQIVTSGLHRTAGPYICAITDQSAVQQILAYSMTSSAREIRDGGTVGSLYQLVLGWRLHGRIAVATYEPAPNE